MPGEGVNWPPRRKQVAPLIRRDAEIRRASALGNQLLKIVGGPDRDRTDDLFHAMEARSQLRHRPTLRKDFLYSPTFGLLSQTGWCADEVSARNSERFKTQSRELFLR
jgi:hypothetical protein